MAQVNQNKNQVKAIVKTQVIKAYVKTQGPIGPASSNLVTSVNGRIGDVVVDKTDVGLSNVDNTSDANKPVSTATQTALNGKVSLTGNETVAGVKTFTSRNIFANNNTDFGATTNNRVSIGNLGTTDRVYFSAFGDATNIRNIYNTKGTGRHEFNANIVLPNDPTAALEAATKQYTDVGRKSRNSTYTIAPTGTDADFNTTGTADQAIINSTASTLSSAGGGTIRLRAGNYTINNKILLYSNVTLEGEGMATIINRANTVNVAMFENADTVNGNTGITVRNMQLRGNYTNNPSNSLGFATSKVSNSRFENIYQTDVSSCFSFKYSMNNRFVGNYGYNPRPDSAMFGFEYGSSYNVIDFNFCDAYTVALNLNGDNGDCNYNVVTNNTFQRDNSPINNGGDCILVINGSSYNTISNNTITDYAEDGIRISDDSCYNTITGNTIYDITRYGIVLATRNIGNVISGNIIRSCQAGVFVDVGSHDNAITSNNIQDCTSDGIYINSANGCNDNIINDNLIFNIPRYGVYLNVSNGNSVTGNRINGNGVGQHGIYLLNSANNTISANNIKNCSQTGIRLQSSVTGTTINNVVSSNRVYDDQITKTQTYGIREITTNSMNPDYNTYVSNNVVNGGTISNLVMLGTNNEFAQNMGY